MRRRGLVALAAAIGLQVACAPLPEPTTTTTPIAPCEAFAWFADADGDGWGDTASLTVGCEFVAGAVHQAGDCDDTDPDVHPDRSDDCDGRDDDCDGAPDGDATFRTWYADVDGDTIGGGASVVACAAPSGFVSSTGDCDDGDPGVWPGAYEVCDGRDGNCDGYLPFGEIDGDGDGWSPCEGDCADADPARSPGATEVCGGVDDDCDLALLMEEFDLDGDGQSPCNGDCDDGDIWVWLGGFETAGDGVDGDCDGLERCRLDADGDGAGGAAFVFSLDLDCDDPGEAATRTDCDDLDPARSEALEEVPYDGVDNDCDVATPDDDLDGDGFLAAEDCDDADPLVSVGATGPVRFVDVTEAAGLDSVSWDRALHPPVCGSEGMSAGATAADYDGDGLVDLFVPRQYETDQLFRNQGDGTFVDVAVAAGIDHAGSTAMGLFLDLEGDGDLDLFAISHAREGNRLYRNQGDGTFAFEPDAGGMAQPIAFPSCSLVYGVAAADVDSDGDLDVHTQQWHVAGNVPGDRSRLFLNDGQGAFTDGTLASGLDLTFCAAFTSQFGDVDGDGDPDLAVAADWQSSKLFLNDGAGSFLDDTVAAGVGLDENGMGSDLADYDGDGDLDWFVTAIYDATVPCPPGWSCGGNFLYRNDGGGTFTDVTDVAGVRNGDWGWGASFFDYDNDGDLDLGMTAGFHLDPEWSDDPVRIWEQAGPGVFADRTCELGVTFQGEGKAFLPVDYDDDGDLDLFTTQTGGSPRLYENVGGDDGSWLKVRLSEPGNPFGIGARVDVIPVAGGASRRRDVNLNNTYMSVRAPEVHVGLGGHESTLAEVRVTWSDGGVTSLVGVAPRQTLTIAR